MKGKWNWQSLFSQASKLKENPHLLSCENWRPRHAYLSFIWNRPSKFLRLIFSKFTFYSSQPLYEGEDSFQTVKIVSNCQEVGMLYLVLQVAEKCTEKTMLPKSLSIEITKLPKAQQPNNKSKGRKSYRKLIFLYFLFLQNWKPFSVHFSGSERSLK